MNPCRCLVILLAAAIGSAPSTAQDPAVLGRASLTPPRAFVENRGQWTNGSFFQMRRGNSIVAVRRDGFTIQMLEIDRGIEAGQDSDSRVGAVTVSGWNLTLRFRGASSNALVQGVDELPGVYNYLRGSDPAEWVTRVGGFARVSIVGLYPGIDLELYERQGLLEYDLVLEPGADPSCIVVDVQGVDAVLHNDTGQLGLRTPWQDVAHSGATCILEGDGAALVAPHVTYRTLSATTFAFEVHGWDGLKQLTIDPTLVYSTCLGGSGGEVPTGLAANGGVVVVAGNTLSADFPLSPGAFQANQMGFGDAFVTTLTADGTALIYSTLLGGVEQDKVDDIVIDPTGLAIVTGFGSPGFPTTPGAFDDVHGGPGQSEAFVTKVSADGSSLVFSTLLGGMDDDPAAAIALGRDGSIYISGLTESPDFPTTPNVIASTLLTEVGAYVSHLSLDGSQLLDSTLLGGTANSKARDLGMDTEGNVYITGHTSGNPSTLIPVTLGAFDTSGNGQGDAFVAKLTADLSSLVYCTYLGGASNEEAWGLAVDIAGAAYVAGVTDSFNFPISDGAFDESESGVQDAFVTKLDPTGSFLVFSTYLGGFGSEDADDIAVDSEGAAYLAGDTTSIPASFPVTPDGWDTTLGGDGDSYLVRLDPAGAKITYGTYIGGNGDLIDECRAMCLDEHSNAFVAGEAFSRDFPTTPGAFDPMMTDFKDSFVVRFAFGPWTMLGGELEGTGNVVPWLSGWGSLDPGSAGEISLLDALPGSPGTLVIGLSQLDTPFKGGTLVPTPVSLMGLTTSPVGEVLLDWPSWPTGIPSGTELFLQAWVADPGGPKGYAASNGLMGTTP